MNRASDYEPARQSQGHRGRRRAQHVQSVVAKMRSGNLIRLGGLAAILGGTLSSRKELIENVALFNVDVNY